MKENDKEDNIFNEDDEEEYKNDNNIRESNANQKLSIFEKDNNLEDSEDKKLDDFDEEERQSLSFDLNDEQERKSMINMIDLEDITQLGTKIRCPTKDCFSNSIIILNPVLFEVNSDCGKHQNKMDIIEFVKNSGISKEGKETCKICNISCQKIIENKNILYKCSCGKIICGKCKNTHLNNVNIGEHNLIDYKTKEYTCYCNNNGLKFIGYCFDCQKNFCELCQKEHTKHNTKLFENIKIEKEKMIQKMNEQKNIILKFNKIIDEWLERVKEFIDLYKKKLELCLKINEKIIEQYDVNKKNYKFIKNIEYMCFDFEDIVINLIKEENNTKLHNKIICNFINENMRKYIELENNKKKGPIQLELKYSKKFKAALTNICELKKKEILVLNVSENLDKTPQFLYICLKTADYNITKSYCSEIEENEILDLLELKNGNLLMIQKNSFNIFDVDKVGSFQLIENQKTDNLMEIIQIIELINGCLISINSGFLENEIIFWKKNLIKGHYEISKKKTLKGAKYILEYDKKSFLVYCLKNKLYLFDSNTGKGKYLGMILSDIPANFQKMMKVEEKGILLFFKECLIMLNMETLAFIQIKKTFLHINSFSNSKNTFIGCSSEKINKINKNELYLIKCDLVKNDIIYKKLSEHSEVINFIFSFDNGDIITFSLDNTIKMWKLGEKAK